MSDQPSDTVQPSEAASGQHHRETVRVRRAPKLWAFLAAGAIVGILAALIATAIFPVDPEVGFGALFGYLLLYGLTIGVVLGGVVGLVLDRRSRSRAGEVTADRETVMESPAGAEPDAFVAPGTESRADPAAIEQPGDEAAPDRDR